MLISKDRYIGVEYGGWKICASLVSFYACEIPIHIPKYSWYLSIHFIYDCTWEKYSVIIILLFLINFFTSLGDSLPSALSVLISVIVIIAFAVGLLVGCLTCLCYICLHKRPKRVSDDYTTATTDKDVPNIWHDIDGTDRSKREGNGQ